MMKVDETKSAAISDAREPRSTTQLPQRSRGRYQFGDERGRGGIGRVTWARDRELDRDVAVKELIDPDGGQEARFVREALITAKLQHPGIVPVYEAGRFSNGDPFYAMKMVSGTSLKDLVATTTTEGERRACVANVLAVADTIAYAHAERVIHRDLKPSNVIVGSYGETVVIDWGLARDLDSDDRDEPASTPYRSASKPSLTRVGAVLGTPAYMSPEQARGERVDERADVYALGAMLYFVLAGRAPFSGDDSDAILAEVKVQPPPALAEVAPGEAPDLVAIVERAMSASVEDRYETARDFAADLRRFQTGKLVTAHSYSGVSLLRRWVARNRALVSLAAAAALVMVVGAGLFVRGLVTERERTEQQRQRAEAQREIAEAALDDLTEERNRLLLVQARAVLATDPTKALAWLKKYEGDDWLRVQDLAADANARGVARYVHPGSDIDVVWRTFFGTDDAVTFADGRQLIHWRPRLGTSDVIAEVPPRIQFQMDRQATFVIYIKDRKLYRYDVATRQTRQVGADNGKIASGDLSLVENDRRALLALRGRFTFWDLDTGETELVVPAADARWHLASANGDMVAVCTPAGSLHLIHRPTGKKATRGCTGPFRFNDDGTRAAVVNGKVISVFDVASGWRDIVPPFEPFGLEFAGRDHLTPAGPNRRRYLLTSLIDGSTVLDYEGPTGVLRSTESPDGRFFVPGFEDGAIHIVDAFGRERQRLRDDGGRLLLSNNQVLVTVAPSGARVFDLALEHQTRLLESDLDIAELDISPNGDRVAIRASIPANEPVSIYNRKSRAIERVRLPAGGALAAVWGAGGEWLALGSNHAVRSWPAKTLELEHKWLEHVVVLRDGASKSTQIATAGRAGNVRVWNAEAGTHRELEGDGSRLVDLVVAEGGRALVSGSRRGEIRRWPVAAGSVQTLHRGKRPINDVTASGEIVAWVDDDGSAQVSEGGAIRVVARRGGPGTQVALSPDGRWLAIGWKSGAVAIRDWRRGLGYDLEAPHGAITGLVFSADGTQVAVAAESGLVRIVALADGALAALRGHTGGVRAMAFEADGTLLTGGDDGALRAWRTHGGVPRDPDGIRAWLTSQTRAEIDRDGEFIQTSVASPK